MIPAEEFMSLKNCFFLVLGLQLASVPAFAQMVEVQDEPAPVQEAPKSTPATGKKKAGSYFQTRKANKPAAESPRQPAGDGAPRYLALHVGGFFSDQGYNWGHGDQEDIGKFNMGLTYRLGEWVNSMDWALRVEYTTYSLDEGTARKISFLPIITFPDANSKFPLYFGAGVGAGFFVKQLAKESALAVDYQLFGGARFLNVIDQVGFMVEAGLKNHLQLFSDGQFNGVFINVGAVFTF
jgi:hypothetical protein